MTMFIACRMNSIRGISTSLFLDLGLKRIRIHFRRTVYSSFRVSDRPVRLSRSENVHIRVLNLDSQAIVDLQWTFDGVILAVATSQNIDLLCRQRLDDLSERQSWTILASFSPSGYVIACTIFQEKRCLFSIAPIASHPVRLQLCDGWRMADLR